MGVTMEFLSLWSLAGLALVPAVFLWGLLAPRGRPVRVGSLMLWRRVLPQGAAGKPSARVRLRDPLIWLDAAAVFLVVLACSRPALKTSEPVEPVATLVIDRSAHMLAGSKPDHQRYQETQALVAGVLRDADMPPIRVIYVPGPDGAVTTEDATSASFFVRAAGLSQPMLVAMDAWLVALAEAVRRSDAPVIVVTDVAPLATVPANIFVLAPGAASRNAGLTRVAARVESGRWWLLVEAKADASVPGPCRLVVSGDGKTLAQQADFLAPGATVSETFAMTDPPPKELAVELFASQPGGLRPPNDDFPYDDAAYLTLEPAARIRIALIGSPDPALRRALAAREDTEVMEVSQDAKVQAGQVEDSTGRADLLIACGEAIPADWTGPAVVILPPQAVGLVRPAGGAGGNLAAPEWRIAPGHPLAQALYLEPPRVAPVRRYAFDVQADLLLGTPDVPLMVTWRESGSRRLAILFGLGELATDWSRRAGFPVFWSHAVEWLVPEQSRAAGYATCRPFEPLPGSTRPSRASGSNDRAPATPGFSADDKGAAIGTSFIGSDEGFRSGPGRDDSQAAIEAIRKSAEARRRAALSELWPYLAAAALAVLIARARVAR
jgi:hypothetical protein